MVSFWYPRKNHSFENNLVSFRFSNFHKFPMYTFLFIDQCLLSSNTLYIKLLERYVCFEFSNSRIIHYYQTGADTHINSHYMHSEKWCVTFCNKVENISQVESFLLEYSCNIKPIRFLNFMHKSQHGKHVSTLKKRK